MKQMPLPTYEAQVMSFTNISSGGNGSATIKLHSTLTFIAHPKKIKSFSSTSQCFLNQKCNITSFKDTRQYVSCHHTLQRTPLIRNTKNKNASHKRVH